MSETVKQNHFFWTNFFKVINPVKQYALGAISGMGATCII